MRIALGLWLLVGLAGCQCCSWTECYQDHIDTWGDHEGRLNGWYHPTWDLSRIGFPDWCECRFNRWYCGERCCHQPPPVMYPSNVIANCPVAGGGTARPPQSTLEPVPAPPGTLPYTPLPDTGPDPTLPDLHESPVPPAPLELEPPKPAPEPAMQSAAEGIRSQKVAPAKHEQPATISPPATRRASAAARSPTVPKN